MIAGAPSSIEIEAALWAIRLNDGEPPAEQQTKLDAWLAADTRHRGALLRAQAGDRQLEQLREAGPIAVEPAIAPSRRRLLAGLGLGAAAGVAAIIAPRLWSSDTRLATTLGEVRRVALEDGSSVVINTRSEVTVSLQEHERRLTLVAGEAWFDVKPDKARPFIVSADDLKVRAVGTAFSVRSGEGATEVIVTEGVVEVQARGLHSPARLVAGSRGLFPAGGGKPVIRAVAPQAIDGALAWREGRIVLDGQSLTAAIAEFNRYNDRALVIDGPAPKRRLVGAFRANDPEGFARAVAPLFSAQVLTTGDKITIRTHRAIMETS